MEKIRNQENNIHDYIFYLAYGILLFFGTLYQTFFAIYFDEYYSRIIVISWGMLILSECCILFSGKYKIKDWIGAAVCGIMFGVLLSNVADTIQFSTFLPLMFVARNIDLKKIAKFTAFFQGILIGGVVLFSLLGVIVNYSGLSYNEIGILNDESRNMFFLGTRCHLYLGNFMLNLTVLIMYIWQKKMKIMVYVILIAINSLVYIATDGRMIYIVSIAMIITSWLYSIEKERFDKLLKKIGGYLSITFFIALIGSYVVTLVYNKNNIWLNKLDVMIGGRFSYAKQAINQYGVGIWGKHVDFNGAGVDVSGVGGRGEYLWVDNAWLNMLIRYGIIVTVVLCFFYSVFVFKLWKQEEYLLICMLLLEICLMFMDDCNTYFFYNSFLILMGNIFGNEKGRSTNQMEKSRGVDMVFEK